jgi:preprotein translocase subunit SecD
MKTIIYILIVVFAFGIIAGGFSNKASAETRIIIQSTDNNTAPSLLTASAKIISARLRNFSSEKFDLTVISEKNQIEVVFTGGWDLKACVDLLTHQGSLSFYATYNRTSFSELLKGDKALVSLLNANGPDRSSTVIGCAKGPDMGKVNLYLKTVKIDEKCKFAWGPSSQNGDQCLYALRLEEGRAILESADIERATFDQDKASGINALLIEFKQSAVKIWADATRRNINNAIAIVLDNQVIYAPLLRDAIEGGKCEITGNFTKSEVQYLAALCNNGVLTTNFKVVK